MKVGLALPSVTPGSAPRPLSYAEVRGWAQRAEEAGFDSIWVPDHFFVDMGGSRRGTLDCWTLLTALAGTTSRMTLGPLVLCNGFRNPGLLAKAAATLNHISGGRFVLGLGAGWFRRDYDEYGYPFGTAGSRLEGLAHALTAIPDRWARLRPPPAHRIPILVGGTGTRVTLRLVASHADRWHAMFPSHPGEAAPLVDALDGWCDRLGRPRDAVGRGVGIEPDRLDHDLHHHADDYVALGFRELTLGVNGPDWDLAPVRDWLAWRDDRNRGPT